MNHLVPTSWRDSAEGLCGELRGKVSSVFDKWLPSRMDSMPRHRDTRLPDYMLSGYGPAIDVEETDDKVTVSAELPGIDEKDFRVELQVNRLILRGEKKASREEKKSGYYYSESSYGSFFRAIPLPCEVNGDKAKASYKRGVLKISMPKAEHAKGRKVPVNVS